MTPGVPAAVEAALSRLEGRPVRITAVTPTSGGCISPGSCIETVRGARYFMKRAAGAVPDDFFSEEARSLATLAEAASVRVPEVLATDRAWLLLEWLEPSPPGPDTWSALGRQLARLHRLSRDRFGWPADNYIGSLPQCNTTGADWPAFWVERRLAPQWRLARDSGHFGSGDDRKFENVVARRSDELGAGNTDGPSLLHGDLWGGNVHITGAGEPALIDPSAYHGHREVDLAMASLFGGFDRAFFDAYAESWPLEPGFAEVRRGLYQLYYILVHVNLFGAGYVSQARSLLTRYG